ncbi:MAG: NADH-quinone oxidoreductase subunit NuoK [Phycisphaeraceae bacterium]|nr:MAG: NADH-quinone oxidoreductase subunit NuoK [Phycisphaeraceae bacterium]
MTREALPIVVAQADALVTGLGGPLTMYHFLFLSAILFSLGVIGFVTRRNMIIMFLCTEMMFQAAGIALIAFSRYHLNHTGEVFVIFVLTIAAAEAALALALVVLLFKRRETLDAENWAALRG